LALVVLLINVNLSHQQFWKNDKAVKQWQQLLPQNGLGEVNANKPEQATQQQSAQQGSQVAGQSQYLEREPQPQFGSYLPPSYPGVQVLPPQPAPLPAPAPYGPIVPPVGPAVGPAVIVPSGPFAIQQPAIGATGEIIIENLVGGIPFNCLGRPTGHYRDSRFADIFHACVYGSQRKTYACPIVGERTYFDEITRR
jgi:hypothetical protein